MVFDTCLYIMVLVIHGIWFDTASPLTFFLCNVKTCNDEKKQLHSFNIYVVYSKVQYGYRLDVFLPSHRKFYVLQQLLRISLSDWLITCGK
jgi:hypothetical protein